MGSINEINYTYFYESVRKMLIIKYLASTNLKQKYKKIIRKGKWIAEGIGKKCEWYQK